MRFLFFLLSLAVAASSVMAERRDSLWAHVTIPVACIRDGRSHGSEMTSQAIMGTPLLVLDSVQGEWLSIMGPEGYRGYMNVSSVALTSHKDMLRWRCAPRLVANDLELVMTERPGSGRRVSELTLGSVVELVEKGHEYDLVRLPDGRRGWVKSSSMLPFESWGNAGFRPYKILETCERLLGAPYLWGACSTKSVDCSGLVRVAYYGEGILTLRDAREQIGIGKRIEPADTVSLRPADLMFFSQTPDGRISHVALYHSPGTYIHSSGRVKINHMSASDPDFSHRVYRGASRIDGSIPSAGIWYVREHPWYSLSGRDSECEGVK